MATPGHKGGRKTIEDWRALPDDARFELIDGELVEKAAPTFDHGIAQGNTRAALDRFHRKPGGPAGPGGWWLATEVDILLNERIFSPDLAGWRRERVPAPLKDRPVALRPDWICEIVSDSNRTTDTVTKLNRYQQAGVAHYWILDQFDQTLSVHRHTSEGYLLVMRAVAADRVRAEPFAEVELHVAALLGADDDDET